MAGDAYVAEALAAMARGVRKPVIEHTLFMQMIDGPEAAWHAVEAELTARPGEDIPQAEIRAMWERAKADIAAA